MAMTGDCVHQLAAAAALQRHEELCGKTPWLDQEEDRRAACAGVDRGSAGQRLRDDMLRQCRARLRDLAAQRHLTISTRVGVNPFRQKYSTLPKCGFFFAEASADKSLRSQ
ncbi:hypothetical protein [Bradyrhizobium sp. 141]|uniref:hypothetical protein n=1 Tax=Bradyrhizobium sp. 141 TaxID=2782617 RepID=UPI001FFC143C|nr:hypothetical protein [Bradyrhizobium sp. 141]MCK1720120.1 hypothetical protein [Bradyrhizobium sp. 141]